MPCALPGSTWMWPALRDADGMPGRAAARSLLATLVGLGLLAATSSCGGEQYRPLLAGDRVPEYEAPALDGTTVRVGAESGPPTLVNVWATWCIPCREEMPALQELHTRFGGRGLRVIGVNIDTGGDGPVREFLDELGVTYLNLRDPRDRITPAWRLVGVPETILVGSDGRIVHRWIGRFDPVAAETVNMVRPALPTATGSRHD